MNSIPSSFAPHNVPSDRRMRLRSICSILNFGLPSLSTSRNAAGTTRPLCVFLCTEGEAQRELWAWDIDDVGDNDVERGVVAAGPVYAGARPKSGVVARVEMLPPLGDEGNVDAVDPIERVAWCDG